MRAADATQKKDKLSKTACLVKCLLKKPRIVPWRGICLKTCLMMTFIEFGHSSPALL
jgi:hypothetical protein